MSFLIHKISFDKNNASRELQYFENKTNKNTIFSIIIGANGTGKSLLLSKIIDIFKDIEEKKNISKSRTKTSLKYYYIKYQINDNIFVIEKNESKYNVSLEDVEIPQSILALSFLPEDKFTFQSQDDNENSTYKYLGIRNTGNAVFSGAVNKKINTLLFQNLSDKIFCQKIVDTFDLLGYKPKMEMKFEYKLKRLVMQSITKKTIDSKINKLKETKFNNTRLLDITEDDKDNIVTYVKKIKKIRGIESKSKVFSKFTIDFTNSIEIYEEYKIVRNMVLLELLSPPVFQLEQKSNQLGFESLSSGEKNLLFITLNILANAKNNSLILIDEPEVSLHPNWQIKYNVHIKKILSGFNNIHVIIATHSHFIVSGLEKEEANIFTIHKDKSIEKIEDDIYSWSSENLLYNIFNVRTVSNYYMKADLNNLLKLVANNGSIDEITELFTKLKKYTYHKDDPLTNVLNTVDVYISNRCK
ncbi:hypothetical protein ALC152_19900 [Arcobacter sp. 15-2]|uniref:AAA family ATPase n=1 Tax=Arcobacter sp. 15-2 TaxID=3374109 RepID=UPI00399CCBAF